MGRDVLEGGEGGSEVGAGGGEGVPWDPPPPRGPLWSPPKAGRNFLSLNPLGTEGAEAKILAVSLQHWKGRGVPPCGDTWVCHVVIALKRIAEATACTAKKRSRLITNRNEGQSRKKIETQKPPPSPTVYSRSNASQGGGEEGCTVGPRRMHTNYAPLEQEGASE